MEQKTHLTWKEDRSVKELDKDSDWARNFFGYSCACNKEGEYSFTNRDDFSRRTLIQVKACDEVVVEGYDALEEGKIIISFQYNPYKLLRLSCIQPGFMKIRQKEVVALKKFVQGQDFCIGIRGYQYIGIKHNLSPNPILLKMFGFREFFENVNIVFKMLSAKGYVIEEYIENLGILKEINECYNQIVSSLEDQKIYSQYESLITQLAILVLDLCYNNPKEELPCYKILKSNCEKYIALMVCQDILVNQKNEMDRDNIIKFFKELFTKFSDNDVRKELVDAAFKQIEKTPDFDNLPEIIGSDNYNNYLKEDKYIFTVVSDYCDFENEINDIKSCKEELTYYTDLYLFKQLSYLTETLKKIKKY